MQSSEEIKKVIDLKKSNDSDSDDEVESQTDHKSIPFKPVPRSALFSQLDMFLPQMQKENEILDKEISKGNKEKFNIEVQEDEKDPEKQLIEMNFALGLMEDEKAGKEPQVSAVDSASLKLPGQSYSKSSGIQELN